MSEHHKIQTLYKRDMSSKRKTLLEGQWTLPEFECLANNLWTFTEKVDGTNIRVVFENGGVTFGGRRDEAQISAQLQRTDVQDVAQKLGLDVVPVIGEGTLHDAVARAQGGIRSTWGDFAAEGIVARPKVELMTRGGQRLIAKIKSRDFAP